MTTTYYQDSPYGMTLSVSGTKQAITSEWLQQFSAFTQGGSIPYWIRYQYQVSFIITGGTVANPTFGGWGPLDETVDKINATPGLRILLPIQQFPSMFWRITSSGQDVGYAGGTPTDPAVLPKWDDYARIAAIIAKRYGDSIQCYQVGNEEYDIQAHSGGVLAPVFNAAYPAIKQWSSSPVVMGAVRKLPPGGTHVSAWMNAFVNYVPKTGEPPQVVPDGSEFHYYRDGSSILSTRFPPGPPYAADPATTDNSLHPGQAAVPSVADEYTIIQPILDTLATGIPVWNMEFGWDNSNAANAHSSYNGTSIPANVSRYTLTQMAQSHLAGISKSMQFTIGQYTDPKTLHKQGLTDYMNYIAANPQWVGTTPPSAYLYQSVDRLDFEGTIGTAPDPQWYAITNPTGSSQSWSVTSSNPAWLTTSTIGTNGIGSTTGAGNTSGTLAAGQRITLVVNADSTHSGLTTLTTLTGTLTVTIGGNVSHITINLWVNPNDAVPSISIDQAQLSPTGAVNGSNPAATTVHITNAGNYTHNWYSYILGSWLSVDVASGTLASGASQAVSISASTAGLAPGLYTETVYFALTPFPAQYKNEAPPTNPEYVSCTVTLKVTSNVAPTVQLSTPVLYFTAGAGSTLPNPPTVQTAQTFFINNCTKSAQNWTVSKTQTWLTLSPTSGTGLPQSGSTTPGTAPNVQSTDYTLVTASINTTALTAGTYTDTITCTLGGSATATITVTYVVTSTSPTVTLGASPTSPTIPSQVQGGVAVTGTTTLTNTGNTDGTWTKVRTYTKGTGWLKITPGTGALTGSGGTQVVTFTCSPGTLTPDTYTATVVFTLSATGATNSTATVTITFVVTAASTLTASPTALTPTQVQSGVAVTAISTLTNSASSGGTCTNVITYTNGSGWLAISPSSPTIAGGGSTQDMTFTCSPGTLTPDTYTAFVIFTLGSSTARVDVTFTVTPSVAGSFTASPTTLTTKQTQGGANVTATTTLSNTGAAGTYMSAITYTNGTGWLAINPVSTLIAATTGTQVVTFTCSTGSLPVDTYTAFVIFTLGSNTVKVNITFKVTAVVPPSITVSPSGLVFTDALGDANNAAPQNVTLTNPTSTNGRWTATIGYNNGDGWITLSLISGTLGAGTSQVVSVQTDDTSLAAGTYTATIGFTVASTTANVSVTLVVTAPLPPVIGSRSNMLSLAVQKTQVVKIYDQFGNFLTVWRDAPLLTGLKSTMNAADGQVKMTLPRRIDAFGGAGQPGTDNSVVLGNNVQIWLYGPGLPSSGLLKLNGVIDIVEPTIDANNAESVTVTITPYGSIVADHGFPGNITLSNVDPISFFTYWFLNNDPTPGLGNVSYANPLTLSPVSATSSGLGPTTYTIQNTPIKSAFDTVMLMLGAGWFWRIDPDKSTLITQLAPVAQHILYLGQHMASMSYSIDNSNRKNVICFVGATGVKAIAVSPISAMPPSQGGLGERIAYYQDSRITDNGSAQIIANGLLSLFDQPLIRIKCRLFDYRGDTRTSLGYDIESISVGDTVSIRDARQMGSPTTWGTFKWGSGVWGKSPGLAFNQIVPVLSIDYNWNYVDLEVGTFQPSQDRQIYKIRSILQDFTVGQS